MSLELGQEKLIFRILPIKLKLFEKKTSLVTNHMQHSFLRTWYSPILSIHSPLFWNPKFHLTKAGQRTLPWARWIQSPALQPIPSRTILILSSKINLCLLNFDIIFQIKLMPPSILILSSKIRLCLPPFWYYLSK